MAEGSWIWEDSREMNGSELGVQCGERDKGTKEQEKNVLSFFFFFFSPSCLGFLESIGSPSVRTSLGGYSSCHPPLTVLVHVSNQNPVIQFKQKHLLRGFPLPCATDMDMNKFLLPSHSWLEERKM